jgi:uncharacterized protein (TIGR03118 family)
MENQPNQDYPTSSSRADAEVTNSSRKEHMMRHNDRILHGRAINAMKGVLLTALILVGSLASRVVAAAGSFYTQSNLVSDIPGLAAVTDTNLQGAWGITRSATSPWWVNSTASGLSLLFNGAGQPLPLIVAIPPTNPATATGIIFNGGDGFQVETGKPARFIFVTLNGTISGWNPTQANPKLAVLKVDNSAHAAYAGVTLAQSNGADTLYVANFAQNSVDVFDTNFNSVTLSAGAFTDESVPSGYSVFNVQLVRDVLYVTYAPTNIFGGGGGPGQGFVSGFDVNGTLVKRLRHGPWMNAPWGVTLAPDDFGHFSKRLLVGMFGNGQIAGFNTRHGNFRGLLRGVDERPVTVGKGLWGLGFGNNTNAGPSTTLYFATDMVNKGVFHGLFGTLTTTSNQPHEGEQGDEDEQGDQDNQ